MVLPKLPSIRSKRELGTSLSEINITPFVDVMLVLLVIFMVTTPMMQSGIGVNLPKAETDTAPAEQGLRLTVDLNKYIYFENSVINISLLKSRLEQYFYGKPKKIIYLQADTLLPYGYVIEIMDIAKKVGVEVVALIVEPIEVKNKDR
jgi:biopolymer transport protein TolR